MAFPALIFKISAKAARFKGADDIFFLYSPQTTAESHQPGTEKQEVQRFGQQVDGQRAIADKIGEGPGIEQGKNHQHEYQCKQHGCFIHDSHSCVIPES